MFWQSQRRNGEARGRGEIDPDDILLDATNLPQFDRSQFEGRLERPISPATILTTGGIFLLIALVLTGKAWVLQVAEAERYKSASEDNRLEHTPIFGARGVLYDRNGMVLASNAPGVRNPDVSLRRYADILGLSHVVGYLKYPLKDSSGYYYSSHFTGLSGAEKLFDDELTGVDGLKILETDAGGVVQSESLLNPSRDGANITLSIDADLTSELYRVIASLARDIPFEGGAGVVMDVTNGEIIALTSYPEFDSDAMTNGERERIARNLSDPHKPFLNRPLSGLYTPGSIVKPFIALGALAEGVITPDTKILSTGSLEVRNPYNPELTTIFKDWKAHGWVSMREAIAQSSNVYFFEIGGGFEGQRGIGVSGIEKYMRMFGFGGEHAESPLFAVTGTIPNPAWKSEHFKSEAWRVGDTYNTSIGQYGFQVTPLEIVRGIAAVANGGKLLTPTIRKGDTTLPQPFDVPISAENFDVVREGMRKGVKEGTARALDTATVSVAAKTGTAELGVNKQFVNSWVTGVFPYESPRYAFAVIMERGPRANTIGASFVMKNLLEWMAENRPEYLR